MQTVEEAIRDTEDTLVQGMSSATEAAAVYALAEKKARDLVYVTQETIQTITPKQRGRIVRIDQIINRRHIADQIGDAVTSYSSVHPDFDAARQNLDDASARIDYLPFWDRQFLRGQVKSVAREINRDAANPGPAYVPPRPKKADRKTYMGFDI